MIGAIVGDILGSRIEGGKLEPAGNLWGLNHQFTDDTVCTIAIADALTSHQDFGLALRAWCSKYPNRGYGRKFHNWVHSCQGPYGSFGNGGAMRVSSCGLLAKTLEEAQILALDSARITHNHPEGLKGAEALASAIWLAFQGESVSRIKSRLERKFGYDLSISLTKMHTDAYYSFSDKAEKTVPEAIISALCSSSFEEAMRNALWIGGDSDTLACMAGGIAEAMHGVPLDLQEKAIAFLDEAMLAVLEKEYA